MHFIFVFRTVIHSKQKVYVIICKRHLFVFPPNHFIDDARVALNDSHNLHGHVFGGTIGHRRTKIAISLHANRHINGLQKLLGIDA